MPDQEEQLLSAREAALRLGVQPRTAQKRARRARRGGDQTVRWIAGAYVAPASWWQELLCTEPITPGRPRKAVRG